MINVSIPAELEPYLIGLWKFRQVCARPTWCTTFMVDGKFYDTPGAATPQRAISKALAALGRVRKVGGKK